MKLESNKYIPSDSDVTFPLPFVAMAFGKSPSFCAYELLEQPRKKGEVEGDEIKEPAPPIDG